jgi:hypothetical protein
MRAIVVKSHSTDTSGRAQTARELTGFPVYGAVALNYPVGGFNPYAVRECAKQGGRIVWMPTIGARHFISIAGNGEMLSQAIPPGVDGLYTLTSEGELKPEVISVLEQVAEYQLILASGHLHETETTALFHKATEFGIKRLIVTHPHVFINMQPKTMVELADLGAFIEITDHGTMAERRSIIDTVGVARCFLSTDSGTVAAPPPVERLACSVNGLLNEGISEDDIRLMVATNPARILGLDQENPL